ncbi:MAG: hypothetical protein LW724_17420 [Planctomycetaceae bacterium]|jgi:hypothetical protein|nr:hypothetical protein [Planctomycetaceae bacterium]
MNNKFLGLLFVCTLCLSGCRILAPQAINNSKQNIAPELLQANSLPIERGKPRAIIDGVGWVVGIPSKLLLWDSRIDNHKIGLETEACVAEYLSQNQMGHVKVRLNQYRPWDDMKRLTKNKSMAWPWRYSIGTLSVLGETIVPGRIFGGDHFNPYSQTIHLYSDVPAIALHEAAHAKDFSRRRYPGTYAALYGLPVVPLYHESLATKDALAYAQETDDPALQQEAYRILYPAYGTYVGGAIGSVLPMASFPAYYGSVILGHAAGRWQAAQVTPKDPSIASAITEREE